MDTQHAAGHSLSALAIVGTLAGKLPLVAAAFAIVWYCVCLYESQTMQAYLRRRWPRLALERRYVYRSQSVK